MLSENNIRQRLESLDKFWESENKRRADKGIGAAWPGDFYWYVYTRQAYLEILEEHLDKAPSKRD
jgi:hypothetical protein